MHEFQTVAGQQNWTIDTKKLDTSKTWSKKSVDWFFKQNGHCGGVSKNTSKHRYLLRVFPQKNTRVFGSGELQESFPSGAGVCSKVCFIVSTGRQGHWRQATYRWQQPMSGVDLQRAPVACELLLKFAVWFRITWKTSRFLTCDFHTSNSNSAVLDQHAIFRKMCLFQEEAVAPLQEQCFNRLCVYGFFYHKSIGTRMTYQSFTSGHVWLRTSSPLERLSLSCFEAESSSLVHKYRNKFNKCNASMHCKKKKGRKVKGNFHHTTTLAAVQNWRGKTSISEQCKDWVLTITDSWEGEC